VRAVIGAKLHQRWRVDEARVAGEQASRVVDAQLLLPLLKKHAAQVLKAEAPDALGDGLAGVARQEQAVGIGAGRQKGVDERLPAH